MSQKSGYIEREMQQTLVEQNSLPPYHTLDEDIHYSLPGQCHCPISFGTFKPCATNLSFSRVDMVKLNLLQEPKWTQKLGLKSFSFLTPGSPRLGMLKSFPPS